MSDDLSELSLMELFRMEAENQLAALNSGLVEIESNPSQSQAEALMRAAHSLKGAARICSLDTAVRLAHEMENVLVAAIEGSLRLTPPHIDWLLEGVDWLGQISRQSETAVESFQQSIQSSVARWIDRLAAIPATIPADPNSQTPAPAQSSPEVATPIPELPAAATTATAPVPGHRPGFVRPRGTGRSRRTDQREQSSASDGIGRGNHPGIPPTGPLQPFPP